MLWRPFPLSLLSFSETAQSAPRGTRPLSHDLVGDSIFRLVLRDWTFDRRFLPGGVRHLVLVFATCAFSGGEESAVMIGLGEATRRIIRNHEQTEEELRAAREELERQITTRTEELQCRVAF